MTDLTSQYGVNTQADDERSGGGLGEGAAATAEQLRRSVSERANAARDWAGERASVAREWASDQTDALRDTVQTRPFIAVGVSAGTAFAAGLVLGILLARR
jgi:ElaB/YqjD/DUF883 family membrane-anchored ribosome-binding protein